MTPGSLSCFQMALWNFSEDSPYGAAAGTADYCGNLNIHVYTLYPGTTSDRNSCVDRPLYLPAAGEGACHLGRFLGIFCRGETGWEGQEEGQEEGQQGSKEVSPITPVSP